MKEYTLWNTNELGSNPELPKYGPFRTNEISSDAYCSNELKFEGLKFEEGYITLKLKNNHSFVDKDGNWSFDGKEGIAIKISLDSLLPFKEGARYPTWIIKRHGTHYTLTEEQHNENS